MSESEIITQHPMRVRIVSPWNRQGRIEANELIEGLTSRIAPVERVSGDGPRDCVVAIDVRPKDLCELASKERSVVLVLAQPRRLQGRNTYLRECRRFTRHQDEDKIKIVEVDHNAGRTVDQWWALNTTLFGMSINYDY